MVTPNFSATFQLKLKLWWGWKYNTIPNATPGAKLKIFMILSVATKKVNINKFNVNLAKRCQCFWVKFFKENIQLISFKLIQEFV